MADRFRELELPQTGRLKDVVLMATVTSYESMRQPRRSDMRQFAELFGPLFLSSSDEARRQAAAALSQCQYIPAATAILIGQQPIAIAAIFLTRAASLEDATLMTIIETTGEAHAEAIARRDDLSPQVVDALVARRQTGIPAARTPRNDQPSSPLLPAGSLQVSPPEAGSASREAERLAREDLLRAELKALVRIGEAAESREAYLFEDEQVLHPADELHQALLVRFARSSEWILLCSTLASALQSSSELATRILLDATGKQLAATLSALSLETADQITVLRHAYPELALLRGAENGAAMLVAAIIPADARRRVESWLRADRYTFSPAPHAPLLAANRPADVRVPAQRPAAEPAKTGRQLRRFAG